MESYVERWARLKREQEEKELAEKKQKAQKRRKKVNEDGTNTRSKGQDRPETTGGQEQACVEQ